MDGRSEITGLDSEYIIVTSYYYTMSCETEESDWASTEGVVPTWEYPNRIILWTTHTSILVLGIP